MTQVEFLKLSPREQDAIVAEKVMGVDFGSKDPWFARTYSKPYTTDIAAAWEVVEKIGCNTKGLLYHDAYVQWQCVLDPHRCTFYDCEISVMADTPALAICLAALKAVGLLED